MLILLQRVVCLGKKKRELLHRVRQSEYVPVANCGLYAINQVL